MVIRCPYCKERIKKGAVRCRHCHSSIGSGKTVNNDSDESIKYLHNGFNKINAECDVIEDRVKARTGLLFIKHQYSSDELMEAARRVESFIEKMNDDLEEWDAANKLNQQVKLQFNKKANEVYQRLETLHWAIEQRIPTWWEKVCTTLKNIISKLLPFLSFKLISGKKAPKEIAA